MNSILIERNVSDTLLQKSKTVEIGGKTYQVAPPSVATLILVSAEVAMLPKIEVNKETDVLTETLRMAKDCRFLGDIIAILILGANGITEKRKVVKKRFFGLVKKETEIEVNKQKELSEILLKHKSPNELNELTTMLLSSMQIGDFFGLSTFLLEINLLRQTREVD
jgi:hypothetical protein